MDLGEVHDGDSVRLLGKQIRVQTQPLLDVLEHVADHQTPRVGVHSAAPEPVVVQRLVENDPHCSQALAESDEASKEDSSHHSEVLAAEGSR